MVQSSVACERVVVFDKKMLRTRRPQAQAHARNPLGFGDPVAAVP